MTPSAYAGDLGRLLSRPNAQPDSDGNIGNLFDPATNSGAAFDTASRAPVTPIVDAA